MKSNYGWYYSTQISLRKNHWRNSELHSNKFLSVTLELDSELDAAKEFRECRRMGKNCFPRLLLGSKRKGKLVPVRVSVPGWLWFRIAFTWWLGHFISRYLKVLFMLIKYMCDSKSQTLRMRYPFQSTGRPISHRNFWLVRVYTVARFRTGAKLYPQYNNRGELTPGWLAPAWHFVVVSCKQM